MKIEITPFSRIIWREEEAKNASILEKWRKECREAEILTVAHKLRDCTTYYIDPENFQKEISKLKKLGLIFLAIKKIENFTYNHCGSFSEKPYSIYGVVSHSLQKAREFLQIYRKNPLGHEKIGQLLGYPTCCIKFFNKYCIGKQEFDPIFLEAKRSKGAKMKIGPAPNIKNLPPGVKAKIVTLKAIPEVNVVLRYFGIRIIPHLPCSFTCRRSQEFSKIFLKFIPSRNQILKFLSQSLIWDCYKGVAIVETKWFQGIASSMSWDDDYHRIVNFI